MSLGFFQVDLNSEIGSIMIVRLEQKGNKASSLFRLPLIRSKNGASFQTWTRARSLALIYSVLWMEKRTMAADLLFQPIGCCCCCCCCMWAIIHTNKLELIFAAAAAGGGCKLACLLACRVNLARQIAAILAAWWWRGLVCTYEDQTEEHGSTTTYTVASWCTIFVRS